MTGIAPARARRGEEGQPAAHPWHEVEIPVFQLCEGGSGELLAGFPGQWPGDG